MAGSAAAAGGAADCRDRRDGTGGLATGRCGYVNPAAPDTFQGCFFSGSEPVGSDRHWKEVKVGWEFAGCGRERQGAS